MQFKDKNKDEMLYNICKLIYAEDPSFKDIKESFKTVYEYKHFNATQIAAKSYVILGFSSRFFHIILALCSD